MKNLGWTLLIWGLPTVIAIAMLYETGKAHGKAEQIELNKAALKAQASANCTPVKQTKKQIDQQCSAWLFETNQREAKKRICGK